MEWTFAINPDSLYNGKMDNKTESVILVGIKHCGKTTQGKRVASRLNIPFFDTDQLISQNEGFSAREIYLAKGKSGFMEAEYNACRKLVAELSGTAAVIATGGGICDNPQAVEELKRVGKVVFLESDEKTAADRIIREAVFSDGGIKELPAYIAKENPTTEQQVRNIFHDFYERRTKAYSSIADVTVKMMNATKEENTANILKAL